MDKFNLYAKYYDLLYQDKDYSGEVDYMDNLLTKYSLSKINNILDLGCGTGKHDFLLSKRGYTLTGVDLSSKMIEIAKSENIQDIRFVEGDVRKVQLNKKFDAVISLFHVASYQTENIDFENYLKTALNHLKVGGLFIFDFWYGPGVITDKPSIRKKELENESLKITRISKPNLFPNNNKVNVNFEVQIENKIDSSLSNINEMHSMRYLFLPEIINFAHRIGFDLLDSFEWMTHKELGFDSWNGVVILRRTK